MHLAILRVALFCYLLLLCDAACCFALPFSALFRSALLYVRLVLRSPCYGLPRVAGR